MVKLLQKFMDPDPDMDCQVPTKPYRVFFLFFLAHVLSFHRILWKSVE